MGSLGTEVPRGDQAAGGSSGRRGWAGTRGAQLTLSVALVGAGGRQG